MDYDFQVGWDLPDAWVIIADAVTEEYVKALAEHTGKPIISIARSFNETQTYVIKCENRLSVQASTNHLIELGHTHIAFIGDLSNSDTKDRFDGYRLALAEAGIAYNGQLLYESWSGGDAAHYYDALGMPCTAVITATDTIALELMKSLQVKGYSLPDDLAITGFDDIAYATKCQPQLTTVRQPTIDLGSVALNE